MSCWLGNTGACGESRERVHEQQRIAELAKLMGGMRGFTSLAYLIDLEWLREAYPRRTPQGSERQAWMR